MEFCSPSHIRQAEAALHPQVVLVQPNLSEQFIVEVDISDSGVVLSQQDLGKMHPCAFFSRCVFSVSDRELLAIKLALEKFSYLQTAK